MTAFLAVGNMCIDDLVYPDGSTLWRVPGGNSVYAALGMAVWGERPGLLSIHGPEYPLAALNGRVDTSFCRHHHVTLRDWGLYEDDGSRQFVFRRATSNWLEFCPELADVPAGPIGCAHLAPLPWDLQAGLTATLRERGARLVSVDPDDRRIAELSRRELVGLLREIDAFLPSRQDAEALFPGAKPDEAMRRLRDLAPDTPVVALKLGSDGVLAHRAGDGVAWLVPPVAPGAVDATGAGDAFCGGFLVGLARHDDVAQAVIMGSVSASFAVQAVGLEGLATAATQEADARRAALATRLEYRNF